jgi:hypothetical protein
MLVERFPTVDVVHPPIQVIRHTRLQEPISICFKRYHSEWRTVLYELVCSHNLGTKCSQVHFVLKEGYNWRNLLKRPMQRSSRHRERSKHDISRIPGDERKRNEEPDDGKIRRSMRPLALASIARSRRLRRGGGARFGRREVGFRKFLGMTAG